MKIIFLHGYSGSPENFTNLPDILKKKFKIKIENTSLPGHGSYDDLIPMNYNDFQKYGKKLIKEPCILIGYSIGALVSLDLAATSKNIKAIIAISTPLALKFPFSLRYPRSRLLFPKNNSDYEQSMKKNKNYLKWVPLNGVSIMQEGGKQLVLSNVKQPVLFIELEKDLLVTQKNRDLLITPKGEVVIVTGTSKHNPFYPRVSQKLEEEITKFIQGVMNRRGLK